MSCTAIMYHLCGSCGGFIRCMELLRKGMRLCKCTYTYALIVVEASFEKGACTDMLCNEVTEHLRARSLSEYTIGFISNSSEYIH